MMKSDQRIAVWEAVNTIRVLNGQNELLWGDFQAFLREFEKASINFDGCLSDAAIERGLANPKYRFAVA